MPAPRDAHYSNWSFLWCSAADAVYCSKYSTNFSHLTPDYEMYFQQRVRNISLFFLDDAPWRILPIYVPAATALGLYSMTIFNKNAFPIARLFPFSLVRASPSTHLCCWMMSIILWMLYWIMPRETLLWSEKYSCIIKRRKIGMRIVYLNFRVIWWENWLCVLRE